MDIKYNVSKVKNSKVEEVKDSSYFLASVDKSEPEIKNKDDVKEWQIIEN